MIVKDPAIIALIIKVADQYNSNISTRFLRPLIVGILAEEDLSRNVSALTEQVDTVEAQGIHIDELYQQILGTSRFIYLVRTNVIPNIRNIASSSGKDANRIYRDMAYNNFGANISVLADLVNELYVKTVEYDKRHSPQNHLAFRDVPGLSEVGRYLVR
jgi:hypothetical protein